METWKRIPWVVWDPPNTSFLFRATVINEKGNVSMDDG
jgi:hypothetical protein